MAKIAVFSLFGCPAIREATPQGPLRARPLHAVSYPLCPPQCRQSELKLHRPDPRLVCRRDPSPSAARPEWCLCRLLAPAIHRSRLQRTPSLRLTTPRLPITEIPPLPGLSPRPLHASQPDLFYLLISFASSCFESGFFSSSYFHFSGLAPTQPVRCNFMDKCRQRVARKSAPKAAGRAPMGAALLNIRAYPVESAPG